MAAAGVAGGEPHVIAVLEEPGEALLVSDVVAGTRLRDHVVEDGAVPEEAQVGDPEVAGPQRRVLARLQEVEDVAEPGSGDLDPNFALKVVFGNDAL